MCNIYLVEPINSEGERISNSSSYDAFVIQAINEENAKSIANFKSGDIKVSLIGTAVSNEECIILDSYNS